MTTTGLDPAAALMRQAFRRYVSSVMVLTYTDAQHHAYGMTMIVVTHEMGFARHAADTVCFFRDGRVLESGQPAEIFDNPRHQETRSFIRGMER